MSKTAKAGTSTGVKPADIPECIADHAAYATLYAIKRFFDDPAANDCYKKWLNDQQRNGVIKSDYVPQ